MHEQTLIQNRTFLCNLVVQEEVISPGAFDDAEERSLTHEGSGSPVDIEPVCPQFLAETVVIDFDDTLLRLRRMASDSVNGLEKKASSVELDVIMEKAGLSVEQQQQIASELMSVDIRTPLSEPARRMLNLLYRDPKSIIGGKELQVALFSKHFGLQFNIVTHNPYYRLVYYYFSDVLKLNSSILKNIKITLSDHQHDPLKQKAFALINAKTPISIIVDDNTHVTAAAVEVYGPGRVLVAQNQKEGLYLRQLQQHIDKAHEDLVKAPAPVDMGFDEEERLVFIPLQPISQNSRSQVIGAEHIKQVAPDSDELTQYLDDDDSDEEWVDEYEESDDEYDEAGDHNHGEPQLDVVIESEGDEAPRYNSKSIFAVESIDALKDNGNFFLIEQRQLAGTTQYELMLKVGSSILFCPITQFREENKWRVRYRIEFDKCSKSIFAKEPVFMPGMKQHVDPKSIAKGTKASVDVLVGRKNELSGFIECAKVILKTYLDYNAMSSADIRGQSIFANKAKGERSNPDQQPASLQIPR